MRRANPARLPAPGRRPPTGPSPTLRATSRFWPTGGGYRPPRVHYAPPWPASRAVWGCDSARRYQSADDGQPLPQTSNRPRWQREYRAGSAPARHPDECQRRNRWTPQRGGRYIQPHASLPLPWWGPAGLFPPLNPAGNQRPPRPQNEPRYGSRATASAPHRRGPDHRVTRRHQ